MGEILYFGGSVSVPGTLRERSWKDQLVHVDLPSPPLHPSLGPTRRSGGQARVFVASNEVGGTFPSVHRKLIHVSVHTESRIGRLHWVPLHRALLGHPFEWGKRLRGVAVER